MHQEEKKIHSVKKYIKKIVIWRYLVSLTTVYIKKEKKTKQVKDEYFFRRLYWSRGQEKKAPHLGTLSCWCTAEEAAQEQKHIREKLLFATPDKQGGSHKGQKGVFTFDWSRVLTQLLKVFRSSRKEDIQAKESFSKVHQRKGWRTEDIAWGILAEYRLSLSWRSCEVI